MRQPLLKRLRRTSIALTAIIICAYICGNLTLTASAATSFQTDSKTENQNIIIVIDPGHGGENNGTTSNDVVEKEMTLKTALAMYEELCKYDGIEVYMTRTTDVEKDISLAKRAEFAEEKNADFLFSIHYNASEYHEMYGSEVWVSAFPPYNSCGYEFAYFQMQHMEEMGLFLRGIKTRIGEDGEDYYGIIRECAYRSVPAVIIEHCYVDESRDVPFCDSDEDLEAFGRADALSVAKYFGLKSEELGVDYSNLSDKADFDKLSKYAIIEETREDLTRPDVCEITLKDTDYTTGNLSLEISAADYDSMLLYYDYSLDGGETFSIRLPWPNTNVFDLTYTDTFTTTIQVPSGIKPKVVVRAYNMYDIYRTSNTIKINETFNYHENASGNTNTQNAIAAGGNAQTPNGNQGGIASQNTTAELSNGELTANNGTTDDTKPGTTTFRPDIVEEETDEEVSIFTFLMIGLVLACILFVTVIVSQIVSRRNRRRR